MQTRQEQIERIRRACVAANPAIRTRRWIEKGIEKDFDREVHLGDVLLAIEEKYTVLALKARKIGSKPRKITTRPRQLFVKNGFLFFETDDKGSLLAYDLRNDTLTNQSDELVSFLSDLLAPSV